ncbi:MAG TPA: thioredoxin domain-containing protein [Flavobacteriaceae bacterium]|nr:thioredoxin domain-containing protein [Flavobacteriaceae bacterium]
MNTGQFKVLIIIQFITLILVGVLFFTKAGKGDHEALQRHYVDETSQAVPLNQHIDIDYSGGHIYGNPEAKNELVIFSDYTCGYCRDFYNNAFKEVQRKYVDSGLLKIKFMNLLDGSEPSLLIKLTEAGIHQNKYEDLQDLFYSKVFADSLDVMRAVRELDLDVEKLLADKDAPITKSRILSEDQQANKADIRNSIICD